MHMGSMSGWMWMMWTVGVALWVSLVVLAIWAVRRFTDCQRSGGARRILEERFARGEIDDEEFRRRLGTLETR